MNDRWLSVDEIALHLGVSRDTIYRWLDSQDLPAHKIGRLWKFQKAEVDEWVKSDGEIIGKSKRKKSTTETKS